MIHITNVVEDPNNPGELVIDLESETCERLGWLPGDLLEWHDLGNGTWRITKKSDAPDGTV